MTDSAHLEVITLLTLAGKRLRQAGKSTDAAAVADVIEWLVECDPENLPPWRHSLTRLVAMREDWQRRCSTCNAILDRSWDKASIHRDRERNITCGGKIVEELALR